MSMISLNGDFDDLLRQALHAEVEPLEPAADGLERILHRTREPWLLRQLSLMLTECADLFWLVAIRLEPGVSKLRQAIATRTGLLRPGVSKLRQAIAARTGLLAAPAGRRHASPSRSARSRSRLAWLRSALAVSAAVVVVVAGVYGLAQLRQSLVLDLFPNAGAPATTGPGAANSGHSSPSVQGHASPGALLAPSGSASATLTPHATCTRSPTDKPTPTPRTTPTPSPTGTPSGTPTPTPTSTIPTPTSTGATTASSVATTSDVALAGHCERARSANSPRAA